MPYSRAVYRAGDNHIHEAWKTSDTTGWHPADLSALGKIGVAVAGNPFGYVSPWDNTARVIWRRGHDGHIWELFLQPEGTWKGSDLSAQAGVNVAADGDPFGYVTPWDNTARVIWRRGHDGHIWELFLQPGGTWKGSDLSAQTSALTAVSDPIAYSSKDRCSVVYRGKQDPGDSAE